MTLWCDDCGDQTVAARPAKLILWNGTEINFNLCLDCSKKLMQSRRILVARILERLREGERNTPTKKEVKNPV